MKDKKKYLALALHGRTSSTGTGEHRIRSGGAAAIVFRYRSRMASVDAIDERFKKIRRFGGDAGVIAITSNRDRDTVLLGRY